jgi:TIR domain
MATRKKTEKPDNETQTEELIISKTKHPLVFVSHDTRDAELAEEFSDLLKKASAGALKSFRSSDKKGTQGIEYGQEWYPAIMDKIDEASDVVCLLTQHSIDRPWILYEAGVAKGKLDKKVIGIAIGIPLSVAVTGPFAQFQNNDGDVDSITKLVLDLVNKVPELDPDHNLVKTLVEEFHEKASEIIEEFEEQETTNVKSESIDENSIAKLFEEVKIMFDNLPSRIESKIDPDSKRRRRRFHPMMFDEIMHLGMKSNNPNLGFLMAISFFKEDFPWLYEIGLETYKGLNSTKSLNTKRKLALSFENALEMLRHPIMEEFYGQSKEMYMFSKDIKHIMRRYLERYLGDEKIRE